MEEWMAGHTSASGPSPFCSLVSLWGSTSSVTPSHIPASSFCLSWSLCSCHLKRVAKGLKRCPTWLFLLGLLCQFFQVAGVGVVSWDGSQRSMQGGGISSNIMWSPSAAALPQRYKQTHPPLIIRARASLRGTEGVFWEPTLNSSLLCFFHHNTPYRITAVKGHCEEKHDGQLAKMLLLMLVRWQWKNLASAAMVTGGGLPSQWFLVLAGLNPS